jgi:hypothetical protein
MAYALDHMVKIELIVERNERLSLFTKAEQHGPR